MGRLGPDSSFERELGLGSLERVELAVRAEREFGVRLPEEAFGSEEGWLTVNTWSPMEMTAERSELVELASTVKCMVLVP